MSSDAAIARLAAKQHNAFTTAQAISLGVTHDAIRRRKGSGRWVVLHRGVYAIAGAPGSARQQLMAAALATDGVVSHTSAGYLHGLYDDVSLPVHVITPKKKRKGIRPHKLTLGPKDVRTIDGIAVTAINRTVFDLASVLPYNALASALDDAVHIGLTTIGSFTRYALDRKRPRTLTKLLKDRAKGAMQKELERRFEAKRKASGLPRPERQYPVGGRKIDFAYPEQRIAIELDGFGAHGTPKALRYDDRRQNEISLAGWTTFLRFTWDDVNGDWPYVDATIRAALAVSR